LFILESLAPGSIAQAFQRGECQVSKKFPLPVRRWCVLITRHANEAGLPPDLIAAVIMKESSGNPLAYSPSGAVGLMQVMPSDGIAATFYCNGEPCFQDRPTTHQLQDPDFNIGYGTQYLKRLIERNFGDRREALRQYGPIDVGYLYADEILRLYARYR
jgi:soluble lytic murein transglycosylase-like protein